MAVVAWTITYGSTEKTLAAWGIRSDVRLTFRNLDVDEMVFVIPRADVLAAPTFPAGADLTLKRDGVGWFRGKVTRPAANGGGRIEADTYTVQNAWASLARLVYQQQWCIDGVLEYTPRVTLGQNQWAQKISIGRQISEIITYALGKGLIVLPGLLPEFTECWLREERDLTCAGAIRTVLQLLPSAVGWCEYSSGAPVLHVQEHTALAEVELDVAAFEVADFSGLAPRSDLAPVGVTFIYQGTDTSSGRPMTTLTRDTAGIPDVEGAIVCLVELNEGEDPPAGAALAYWAALQTTPWQGTIRTVERECTGAMRPGKVLNITNGRADWAGMRGVIQGVTENLATGETVAEIGLPEHLAVQDFIEQQRIARRRPIPTMFPLVQPCETAEDDDGDPEEGEPPEDPEENPDAGVDPGALAQEKRNSAGGGAGLPSQSVSTCDPESGESSTSNFVIKTGA